MESWVYVVIVLVAVILVAVVGLIVFQVLQSRKKSKEPEHPVQDQNAEVAKELSVLTNRIATLETASNTASSSTKTALDNLLQRQSETADNKSKEIKSALQGAVSSEMIKLHDENKKLTDQGHGDMAKSLANIQTSLAENVKNIQATLSQTLNQRIDILEKQVTQRLNDSFEATGKNLNQVNQALGEMNETKKNIEKLDRQVSSLNNTLSNSKTRGRFGEMGMETLIQDFFGDAGSTQGIYEFQKSLPNSTVKPDAVVNLPEPNRAICIDSKFSFTNYVKLLEEGTSEKEADDLKKTLAAEMNGQIDKIARDYIVPDITAPYAIMFIPSDGLFAFIQSDEYLYKKVVKHAQAMKIVICSPSTLIAILANVNSIWMSYKQDKNLKAVVKQMDQFRDNLKRIKDRWEDYTKEMEKLEKIRSGLDTSFKKMTQEADQIASYSVSEEKEEPAAIPQGD